MGPLRLTQEVLAVYLDGGSPSALSPKLWPETSEYCRQGLVLDLEGGWEAPWLKQLEERLLTLLSLILKAALQGTEISITNLIRRKLILCEVASPKPPSLDLLA